MADIENKGRPFRRWVSAALLPCLLISFALWYIIKLSYTYTATVPITVNIEGNRLKIICLVEATGYRLFAHRYIIDNNVNITLKDVDAIPSVVNKESYVLNPFSLQNIISLNNTDLRIISLGEIPEVAVHQEE